MESGNVRALEQSVVPKTSAMKPACGGTIRNGTIKHPGTHFINLLSDPNADVKISAAVQDLGGEPLLVRTHQDGRMVTRKGHLR
jgi:hypothetical protein